MQNSFDLNSIRGTTLTLSTYVVSLMDMDILFKIGLMTIGIISGITTIVYNIKKINKLNDNEKR
jgi:hypothetical protein